MSDNEFKIDKKISNDDKLYYDYSNESNSFYSLIYESSLINISSLLILSLL